VGTVLKKKGEISDAVEGYNGVLSEPKFLVQGVHDSCSSFCTDRAIITFNVILLYKLRNFENKAI
jgi:hypothetical protein